MRSLFLNTILHPQRTPTMPQPVFASRRARWLATSALLVIGVVVLADQWQRRPSGPLLQASSQRWSLGNNDFEIQLDSLQLQPLAGTSLITGSFSRAIDAAPDSLPPGLLLETLLPEWQTRSAAQSRQLPLPSLGTSMQERLLQEALRTAQENARSGNLPEDDKAQALQWLSFRDRQFIAQLPATGPLQINASLAAPGLDLHSGNAPGRLLLEAGTDGHHLWSQSTFTSADHGLHWQWQAQPELPKALDQFGWVNPQTSFGWRSLEKALLISHDGGNTWGQPTVQTPLAVAATEPVPPPAPHSAAAWHAKHELKAFAPAIWGDLATDPLLEAEYETLLAPDLSGQLRGWSTRWTRTLNPQGTPQGEWQAALTRRFTLHIPPAPAPLQVRDISPADDIDAIHRHPSGQLLRSSNGGLTRLYKGSVQHLDVQTGRWQAPVRLPLPRWHHSSTAQLWTGNSVWISHSSSPALLDLASCLLPDRMPLHARCKQPNSQAFHISRDQGRSWQGFTLPHAAHSHIVGWDEEKQMLLVAEPIAEPVGDTAKAPGVSLVHYAIP